MHAERRDALQQATCSLEAAREGLADSKESALGSYRLLLDAGEHDLAFVRLVLAAHEQAAPRSVWESLQRASRALNLSEDVGYPFSIVMQLLRQHLR